VSALFVRGSDGRVVLTSPQYRRHLEHERMNERAEAEIECGQGRARRVVAEIRSGAAASLTFPSLPT